MERSNGAVAGFQPGVINPGKEAMVRKLLVFLALVCVLGSVAAVGQLAGRIDLSFEMAPFPSTLYTDSSLASVSPKGVGLGGPIDSPFLFLTIEYGIDSWTFGTLVTFAPYGLDGVLFGARGALGPIQVVSYMDFYAGGFAYVDDGFGDLYGGDKLVLYDGAAKIPFFDPFFSEWWNLAWTSLAGLDLWAMGGVVNPVVYFDHALTVTGVGPKDDCCTLDGEGGFGLSLGAHGGTGGLEVWAEANFGAGHIVDELAYWDFSLARIAGSWYQCHWGDIYGPCAIGFSDVVVYANSPFICGMLLARLEIDCDGFDNLALLMRDLRFGIDWLYVDELGITFTTDSKDVCLDFAVKAPEILCIQPYFSLALDGQNAIEGLTLGALTMEYQWNGVTFVAVETLDCRYGITLDARLVDLDSYYEDSCSGYGVEPCSWRDICLFPGDINEAFGLEFGSDACCGGGLSSGFYVFFDHEQEIESLFDWSAARAEIKVGIGANLESSLSGMFFAEGTQWYTFRVTFTWGTLRIFDYKPSFCDFWYAVAT